MRTSHTPYHAELAKAALIHVERLGFSRASLYAGARSLGLSEAEADLWCPNGGADLAALMWRETNIGLEAETDAETLKSLKIREKIAHLVTAFVDHLCQDAKLAKRLMGCLALPHHLGLAQKLVWESADLIWRMAGDTALDENHYSKRTIVSGIVSSGVATTLFQGREAFISQLDRHIDAVMKFEKFKAGIKFNPETALLDLAQKFGAVRFGQVAEPPVTPGPSS